MAVWDKINTRGNVEDRRSLGPVALGGISLTGVALLVAFNLLTGGDLGDVLSQLQSLPIQTQQVVENPEFAGEDAYEVFASTVLGSTNELWQQEFSRTNREFTQPTMVLFRVATQSACGTATSQVGPHYCPLDNTIYLDETFFEELTNRLGAQGGDVAEAYVIAHEAAHHAQQELGIMQQVQTLEQTEPERANEVSIALELQADCFAGLWFNSIKDLGVLEAGEIGEAMDAAAAVGDDRIQAKTTGRINPESWTHGSAEQRLAWFNRGYEQGSLDACNIEL